MGNDTLSQRGLARALVAAMRPAQWVKNVLVLVAPAAAGVAFHATILENCAIAFVAFCLEASGVYLLNDVRDIEADRAHPTKRHRPIPAGQLPERTALFFGIILILAGIGVSQIRPNLGLGVILGIYAVNSLAYIYGVKRIAVIEMASVATGFILRSLAGATVNHLYVSEWFLVVISFGALFLVVGKRAAELSHLGERAGSHRIVLNDYSESFLNSALTLTATVIVTGYCLWAFDTSSTGLSSLHHHILAIRLTVVPVVLVILHILRVLESKAGGAPEDLVLEDRTVQALGVVWCVLLAIGIYA